MGIESAHTSMTFVPSKTFPGHLKLLKINNIKAPGFKKLIFDQVLHSCQHRSGPGMIYGSDNHWFALVLCEIQKDQ